MLSTKQINSKIAGIRKSSDAIRRNVHEVLCSVAGHALEHKDVSGFTRLIDATTGVNQKRIMSWIRDNGLATWNKDKNSYQLNKSAQDDCATNFVDGATYSMHLFMECDAWYVEAEKPSEIAKELDATQRIRSLRSQIAKGDKVVKVADFQALRAEMDCLLADCQQYA